jgi:triosephosphate isomerase
MRMLIVGNWKMNGLTAEAGALARAVAEGAAGLACDLVVCPPATQLAQVGALLAGGPVGLGAQDCHMAPPGAHTGDIAVAMLRDLGAGWVILGHSERRRDHGEIDETVREKAVAAAAGGLVPIVCVGETQDQRAGGQETEVVGWQLEGSLPKDFAGVVAYEPVWAIGSGRSATVEDVASMHAFIRAEVGRQFGPAGAAIRILYGGSVTPDNAAGILAMPEVAGALVGGASLRAEQFLAIARAASDQAGGGAAGGGAAGGGAAGSALA